MFSYCADPSSISGLAWLSCYLTTNNHFSLYSSVLTVLLLLACAAPMALAFGFGGAMAKRSKFLPLSWFGSIYTNMIRGVPEIIFFLFVPIALDQAFEYVRHLLLCPDPSAAVYQGNEFIVCAAAKLPLNTAEPWVHSTYSLMLAILGFSIVFGAFAANVIDGALRAVPKAQLETAAAIGMTDRQVFWRIHVKQMWAFALSGLSNLWIILVKSTPLLFLLGIEDVVYWAKYLGATKTTGYFEYPHPDWRFWYFLALLVFYMFMTWASEHILGKISRRLSKGQATLGNLQDTGIRA